MLSDPQAAAPGSRRFRFVECLGRGGFGEVYRAAMTDRGGVRTEVAVKVLHEEVDPASQAVQRLRDEAHVLAALRHPAILKVHDLVVLEGRAALVTEFVDGEDLSQLLHHGARIPLRPLLDVVGQVASALDAAHRATGESGPLGLVHRDVKPQNIRVGRHGEVKLLDFGIARGHGLQRSAHTTQDSVVGSWQYMAPEALEGRVGPASDVFSLGCVLFEGLARQRIWTGLEPHEQYAISQSTASLRARLDERLARVPADVPAPVQALCRDLLAPTAEGRPTAADVARRCEDLVERTEGPALRRWCAERPWPTTARRRGEFDGREVVEGSAAAASALRPPAAVATVGDDGPPDTLERTVPRRSPGPARAVAMAASGMAGLLLGVAALCAVLLLAIGVFAWNRPTPAPEPPRPAPVAAPLARPGPAPEPAPPPPAPADPAPRAPEPTAARPAPEPAPAAGAPATVSLDDRTKVKVRAERSGSTVELPGDLPAGTWTLMGDFGAGYVRAGSLTVGPGERRVVWCNGLLRTCSGR